MKKNSTETGGSRPKLAIRIQFKIQLTAMNDVASYIS